MGETEGYSKILTGICRIVCEYSAWTRIWPWTEQVAQGYPEIEQPQPGDDTANGPVGDEVHEPGRLRKQRVSVPCGRIPRCETDEKTKVDPDEDAQKSLRLLEPVGNALRSV